MGDQNTWSNPAVTFWKKTGNGAFVMNMGKKNTFGYFLLEACMDIFWKGAPSPKPVFFKNLINPACLIYPVLIHSSTLYLSLTLQAWQCPRHDVSQIDKTGAETWLRHTFGGKKCSNYWFCGDQWLGSISDSQGTLWFQTFFIFTYKWGNDPIWLAYIFSEPPPR